MKYTYKTVVIKGNPMDVKSLNELGKERWRLVGCLLHTDEGPSYRVDTFYYYFIRKETI